MSLTPTQDLVERLEKAEQKIKELNHSAWQAKRQLETFEQRLDKILAMARPAPSPNLPGPPSTAGQAPCAGCGDEGQKSPVVPQPAGTSKTGL